MHYSLHQCATMFKSQCVDDDEQINQHRKTAHKKQTYRQPEHSHGKQQQQQNENE